MIKKYVYRLNEEEITQMFVLAEGIGDARKLWGRLIGRTKEVFNKNNVELLRSKQTTKYDNESSKVLYEKQIKLIDAMTTTQVVQWTKKNKSKNKARIRKTNEEETKDNSKFRWGLFD